ncbi:MAG: HEAT repeat domain-containing protein [Bryobacteraceae bacterium]
MKLFTDSGANELRRRATDALLALPDNDQWLATLLERELDSIGNSGDPLVLISLEGALAERKAAEAVPVFNRMLSDPRVEALHEDLAEILGQMGDVSSVPSLIAALSSEHVWVRAKAARSLARLAGPRATVPLVSLLKDESDTVRENAINGLVETNATTAAGALLELAGSEDETYVREVAIRALGRLHVREAAPLFRTLSAHGEDEDIRKAAADALSMLEGSK